MLTIGDLVVESLDYIFIVDKNYKIIFNTRYDYRLNVDSKDYPSYEFQNKNFFDVYPTLRREDSSIVRCMEKGEIVVNKRQVIYDYLGRRYVTNNVTFPLVRKGELMAVVELSMDADEDTPDAEVQGPDKRFDDFVTKIKKDAGLITFDTILTKNDQMKLNIEKARILAGMPTPTLIYGETGTGKELFAQAMINASKVPKNKVVIQNCAAVPDNLMESILFGTVRGAYTGAENKTGLFEQADGGILFLDELNSIPYNVQSKLLRVLQDGTFRPLGASHDRRVNVKVIAAMNVDPVEAMENKIIRADLFFRLSGGLISLLPLRERKEDIALFMDYYLNYFSAMYGRDVPKISKTAKKMMIEYSWPGNVRELRNAIESMIASGGTKTELGENEMPAYLLKQMKSEKDAEDAVISTPESEELFTFSEDGRLDYHETMKSLEKKLIEEAIEKAGGNVRKAAQNLGIPRETLRYRISKLGIET